MSPLSVAVRVSLSCAALAWPVVASIPGVPNMPSMPGVPQLADIMSSLDEYQNKETCESCVRKSKDWCVATESCDEDECEDEDLISPIPNPLLALELREAAEVDADGEISNTNATNKAESDLQVALAQCRRLRESELYRKPLAPGVLVEVSADRSPDLQSLFIEVDASPNRPNAVGVSSRNFVGVVLRAYQSLDEFTVADKLGYEVKTPMTEDEWKAETGMPDSPNGMGGSDEMSDDEKRMTRAKKGWSRWNTPRYFSGSELRVISGMRKGDRVMSYFYASGGSGEPAVQSKKMEEAVVVNATVATIGLNYTRDYVVDVVPRDWVTPLHNGPSTDNKNESGGEGIDEGTTAQSS